MNRIGRWVGMLGFLGMIYSGWSQSTPVDLPQAIQLALRNNPDAEAAEARLEAARHLVRQSYAAFGPRLSVDSGYIVTDNPTRVFGGILNQRTFGPSLNFNDVPTLDMGQVGAQVSIPLYAGGSLMAGKAWSQAHRGFRQANREEVQRGLTLEVARSYFSIYQMEQILQASRAAIGSFEGNVVVAQKRFDVGQALKQEVLDLQVQLARAKEDHVVQGNLLQVQRMALGTLMGLSAEPVATHSELPELTLPPRTQESERPEQRMAQKQVEMAAADEKTARAGHLPRVEGFGRVDLDRGWRRDGHGESWMAGIQMQWNIWDNWMTQAKVKEAIAKESEAKSMQRKVDLAMDLERAQAWSRWEAAEERVRVSQTAIALAEESASLVRSRFAQGLALSTQLIDSETALTQAKVRLAEALSERMMAIAWVRYSMGWPVVENVVTP